MQAAIPRSAWRALAVLRQEDGSLVEGTVDIAFYEDPADFATKLIERFGSSSAAVVAGQKTSFGK